MASCAQLEQNTHFPSLDYHIDSIIQLFIGWKRQIYSSLRIATKAQHLNGYDQQNFIFSWQVLHEKIKIKVSSVQIFSKMESNGSNI